VAVNAASRNAQQVQHKAVAGAGKANEVVRVQAKVKPKPVETWASLPPVIIGN